MNKLENIMHGGELTIYLEKDSASAIRIVEEFAGKEYAYSFSFSDLGKVYMVVCHRIKNIVVY